jgi:hypothetical protein
VRTLTTAAALVLGLALAAPWPASAAPWLGRSALSQSVLSQSVLSPESATGIAGWTQTGSYLESSLTADEGVATVTPASGSLYELYRY